jgi:hypothetical protein
MFKRFSKLFKKIFFPGLIIILVLILAGRNYLPGTWLSGWDTLHPEFNFPLYLKRIFFGVWQEHQGLGAVASQAHMAELSRIIISFLLSLFLPLNSVRFSFFFLCLVLGGLGVYFFTQYLLSQDRIKSIKTASFLASLFYILNLTTLQQFYVPLEMFALHFASLPWLIFLAIKFLREGKRSSLFFFVLVTIFSSGVAHTATLFYVYFLSLFIFILSSIVLVRRKTTLKRGIVLLLLTFLLNVYWILPNVYYIKNHAQEVENSKIHSIFTGEAFLQSRSFGDLKNLALGKNFLFNWREFDTKNNQFVDLLDEWKEHLNKPNVSAIGYGFFVLGLLGVVISLFRKSKYTIALLPLFVFSVAFWINENVPLTGLFEYLRGNFDLFKEGLRFPFTKFSILLIFCLTTYFSFTAQFILEKLTKVKLNITLVLVGAASLIYFMWPAFNGYLISPSMKVQIPNEYFEVFAWFKNHAEGRVAKLPLQTFWGWNFYSWDYQGAGFTWFGIPNPTLDREFDRWSYHNEGFYNQASFAIYNQNLKSFEEILEKYQVKYLLLDESIINAGGTPDVLFRREIKGMLAESSKIKNVVNFNFLTVYEANFDLGNKFISAPEKYAKVNVNLDYSQIDPIYSKYGNYIQDEEGIGYPFVNFDKRADVAISLNEGEITFINQKLNSKVILPIKEKITEDFSKDRGFTEAYNCDLKKLGEITKGNQGDKIVYEATDGGVSCDFFDYPTLKHNQGYLLHITGENKEGRSLKIYLQNYTTDKMDLEELLPQGKFDETFVILPKDDKEGGYTLNLETRSFGRIASKNILEKIEFIPVNIDWFTSLYSDRDNTINLESNLKINETKKIGTTFYLVKTEGKGLLELGQRYEKGWVALDKTDGWLKAKKLEHFKVNSWANGWLVEDNSQILIFFWPQLLEWGGMILGGLTLFALIIFKPVDRR